MTRFRAYVEQRRTNPQDVVNLTRMDKAHKMIAHHNQVQISGRERPRQLVQSAGKGGTACLKARARSQTA